MIKTMLKTTNRMRKSLSIAILGGCLALSGGAAPTITVPPASMSRCVGQSATFSVTATGNGTLTYQWKFGGSNIPGETNDTYTIASVQASHAGAYTVLVTDLDGSTLSAPPAFLPVMPVPTASVNSAAICPGGSATLTATTGASYPTYLWSPGGETTPSITVSPAVSTTYTVTVTDGNTGCSASASGQVSITPPPTVSVNSATFCAGGSATLTATTDASSATYLWSPGGQTTASITVSPAVSTTYTVTVTDGVTGCSASASGQVGFNPLPSVSVNSATLCAGGSATLTATTGAASPTYLWSPGGATTPSITVSPAVSTTYTVTVTDGVTGCSASAAGQVSVTPLPTVSVNSATICAGGSATLTATTDASSPTYLWSPGGATTPSITVSPAASTNYTVTVTDGVTGCSASAAGPVSVTPLPTVSVNSAAICAGGSATLTATTDAASATYLWSPGGATTPEITVSPAVSTTYTVTVTDGVTGCSASAVGRVGVSSVVANWALSGVASASSAYQNVALPSRAIDGNRDGVFGNNSTFHSGTTAQDWWRVDLGTARPIKRIKLWFRTDCCGERNTNIEVRVYQGATTATTLLFAATNKTATSFTTPLTFDLPTAVNGQLVEVQTRLANYLMLAEVEVFSAVYSAGDATQLAVTPAPAAVTLPEYTPATLGPVAPVVTPDCGPLPAAEYQWQRNGTNLAGATAASYTFTPTGADNGAQYSCVVTLPGLSVTGLVATLTTTPVAPVIVTQPANILTRMAGGVDSFTVTAAGSAPLSYQWYSNDVLIAGATAATYALSNLAYGSSGSFQVVVANAQGSATSAVATLTVLASTGISFDFNTQFQYTNVFYNLGNNDWIQNVLPTVIWETNIGGVNGTGGLDVTGTSDSSSIIHAMGYDFSVHGRKLVASVMVQLAAPTQNSRNTQIGFVTSTNLGIADTSPQGFMTVILQSTAQPALTYNLRLQHRRTDGGIAEVVPLHAVSNVLVAGNWYKLVGTFLNQRASASNITFTATLQDMGANGVTPGAIVLAYAPTNVVNVNLVTQRAMYMAIRTARSDTGANFWDNAYAYTTEGEVFMVARPQDQTVKQGRTTVFRAYADGTGPYAYQWQKSDGLGGFTNIPNAIMWKYVTPPVLLADDGAQYQVVINGPSNLVTSLPATLTVQADPLAVVSVGSVDGDLVGLRFNQAVDKASAETPANYLINGTAAVNAVLRPDGLSVVLTPAGNVTGSFNVTAQNVLDLSGGTVGTNNIGFGQVANLTSLDISTATAMVMPVGSTYSFAPNAFEVTAGGVDIWNAADSFRYVYTQRTGDFDVKMHIPYMDIVAGASKAGLMVRPSLEPTSPMMTAAVNPLWPGRNYYEGSRRDFYNIAATSWGTTTAASFTNAWLRFRRVANTFSRYSSTNGVDWRLDGQTSLIMPSTMYFGLAVCSVRNSMPPTPINVVIDSLSDFPGYSSGTITLISQPVSVTVAAGGNASFGCAATNTGPAAASELAYIWQRNDGSGNWTNTLVAGLNSGVQSFGPLYLQDNGAQFRCVVALPGGISVTSAVVSATVTDTAVPTVSSSSLPALSAYNLALYFSEPLDASALNLANFTVTNAAGVNMGVAGAVFLNGDPRTIVLTTSNLLEKGAYGVVLNNLKDLNNNTIAANTVRNFTQVATPPMLPVVIEVYQDIANAVAVSALTGNAMYTAGTPTWITYSNLFGYNIAAGSSITDNYGVKAYTYFVPPTNGNYKFWIRSDDGFELWMNTNGPDPLVSIQSTVIPSSANFPAAESALNALDHNTGTKYLNFDKLNTGFTVKLAQGAKVVTSVRLATANDAPERDPMTFTLEGAAATNGPWTTLVANASTGFETDPGRLFTGPAIPIANATAYAVYRVTFPTVRDAGAANSMQIADVWLLDAAANEVSASITLGATLIVANTAANGTYSVGTAPATSITNIALQAGKPYYMMALLKEATGNDGFSVCWTDPAVTAVPAATTYIPTANLAYPATVAPATPVVTEIYQNYPTPYGTVNLGGATLAEIGLFTTNYGVGEFFMASLPSGVVYQKYFATQPQLGNTRYDNYLGRMYSYFVPPSNGLYRFYLASDDASILYLNTNAVDSMNPAGKSFLTQLATWSLNYQAGIVATNVPLVGGQKYYMEVLWKEGGGGDGAKVAVRAQADTALPPNTEVIPATMLAFPYGVDRVGAVKVAGLTPSSPVATDGQTITFAGLGVSGAPPYSFLWLKNGQPIYVGSPYSGLPLFTTQPLNPSDNGAVFTLVVTNVFSRAEISTTVTVVPSTPPVILGVLGSQYRNSVTLLFNQVLDLRSAQDVGNYSIPGLTVLSAYLDTDATGTKVSLGTSAQTPGQNYTVAVNGVRNRSSAGDMVNATTNFTAWGVGGNAILVEIFTNIANTTIPSLTNDPRFIGNFPDYWGYVNRWGYDSRAGQNATANLNGLPALPGDGLAFYGVRMSAYFIAPSNGLYRFYIRSDDLSALWMNTNGMDPAGKVLIAAMDIACCKAYSDASGGLNNSALRVGQISLTNGQLYYIEMLGKEGGGGDVFTMAFREANDASVPADTEMAPGLFFTTPGNPDYIQFLVNQTPPTEVAVMENDLVTLNASVTVLPASASSLSLFQWQKWDEAGLVWTNIPGALGSTLSFYAQLADDGRQYRFQVSAPGTEKNLSTLVHVTQDFTPPYIVSAGSLDGTNIVVKFNERISPQFANESLNWTVNLGANTITSIAQRSDTVNGVLTPFLDQVLLTLENPVSGAFTVEASQMHDLAVADNVADSAVAGVVTPYLDQDVGTAGTDPFYAGHGYMMAADALDVMAGGTDIWNAVDGMHYVYRQVSGNFDIKTRVNGLAVANTWSKAGLMARVTTNANSRNMAFLIAPPTLAGGQDTYTFQYRDTDGAAPGSFYKNIGQGVFTNVPSAFGTNVWLRFKREGAVFSGYFSSNGLDWTFYTNRVTPTTGGGAFPATLLVGFAVTSHDNTSTNKMTLAQFRDIYFPLAPAITTQPVGADLAIHQSYMFSVEAVSAPEAGVVTYQWWKDGRLVPGANVATLLLTNLAAADAGSYTVAAANDGGGTLSDPALLTVLNLPPVASPKTLLEQTCDFTASAAQVLAGDTDPEGDPLVLIGVSGVAPVTFAANFDDGLVPPGAALYGSATVFATGGVNDTGNLHLTDAVGSVTGGFVLNDLVPGRSISAFTARYKIRIGDGSANPADGFSFNLAPDITDGTAAAAEEGAGTGLTVCIDNYDSGGGEAPAIDVKYAGVQIGHVMVTKINDPRWIDMVIDLKANGLLTVSYDSTNVFTDLATGFVPKPGARFGLYGRTGGQYETHWLDDLSITVLTADTALGNFVALDLPNGTVSYVYSNTCGIDAFYYLVSDGQIDGTTLGQVTVNHPPLARNDQMTATSGRPSSLALAKLRANDYNADGVALTLTYTQPTNGTVVLTDTTATYTSTLGFVGKDAWTYTLDDGRGNTATAVVTVTVKAGTVTMAAVVDSAIKNGHFWAKFFWAPNTTYHVETTTNVAAGPWVPFGSVTSDATGMIEFTDTVNNPAEGQRYYRIVP